MALQCGIVGLPNVGKSTLFNALTNTQKAEAANYPFCTIEPNTGVVSVPDFRLKELCRLAGSQEIIPTFLEFVDIAGLVRNASKGEGLGNQFLSHIRTVDLILHVVRCFDDSEIIHVEGNINPLRDVEIIETELILADLQSLEQQALRLEKRAKSSAEDKELLDFARILIKHLNENKLANSFHGDEKQLDLMKKLQLLTSKPVIYVCNVLEGEINKENPYVKAVSELAEARNTISIKISSKIESEISLLDEPEQIMFLEELGLKESGLNQIIRTSYRALGLITYFTVGPKEAHAWTVKTGTKAPEAAGVIHSDIERGFIRAEVISYRDFAELGGEKQVVAAGKMRVEGKEYIMQDGDICHFRFNV